MNETKWERYGASAGIAFVILFIASVFVAPQPPHLDASPAKLTSYLTAHRRALVTAMFLGAAASLVLLWFVGHLRHVLQRAEHGSEALSPAVFGSGVALAGLGLVSVLPMGTLALLAGRPGDPHSDAVTRLMFDLDYTTLAVLSLGAGLFVLTTSMALVRRELLSPNLGWLGFLFTAVLWIGGAAAMYLTTYSRTVDIVNLAGTLGFALWMLLSSAAMYQHPELSRAERHQPTFAA